MQGDFKIIWSQNAEAELDATVEYLENFFSEKEVAGLLKEINRITKLIAEQPSLFPKSEKDEIQKAVLLKYNTLYYKTIGKDIFIVSFFSNRQSPEKRTFLNKKSFPKPAR